MKRNFADLHLRLNLKDSATASRIINKTAKLGYHLIAVPITPETSQDETTKLQRVCNEAKIEIGRAHV
jgi:hypothetical protein